MTERKADGAAEMAADHPGRATLLADAGALVAYLHAHLAGRRYVERSPVADARIAAVLAPLYAVEGAPYLLFTRRTTTLSKHRGEISFPGGSRDTTDPSVAYTALREAQEELGLDGTRVHLLGALEPVYAAVSNFHIFPQVGWLGECLPPLVPNPAEVAQVIHAPLAALADPAIYHSELWSRGGAAHEVHFYDLGPDRIWGLTGHIVRDFLALLPPA